MKQFALFLILMLACCIPVKLYACKNDQDSTKTFDKKVFDKNIPNPMNKTKTILSDASGNNLTHNIKKTFLNGKKIQINSIDSIKAKDVKSITTKKVENGDIWLYIETKEPKSESASEKTNNTVLKIEPKKKEK